MHQIITFPKPSALHIPDGFLSLPVALLLWILSIVMILFAARRTQRELGERRIPLMGVMAAFIFAAQMINFPVVGGTSGHLLGGVLAAITLGPWAGMLVMASVIGIQGLLFQDGGLVVMGANIFNMGVLPVLIGYSLHHTAAIRGRGVRLAMIGIAAWLSVMGAALITALQLWLSGTALLTIVVPAMLGLHAMIGTGEALITVAALAFILQTRPDLIEAKNADQRVGPGWIVAGLAISLLVVLLAPLASIYPDGLERVAIDLGFLARAAASPFRFLPDYSIPGFPNSNLARILAGAIGALVVALTITLLALLLRRPSRRKT